MKKVLFLLAMLPMFVFTACSSDDDIEGPIIKSSLIGSWSTGVEDIHKYIEFESDGTGFYAIYNGANMGQNYLFSYEVDEKTISIKITYSETKGLIGKNKQWNCEFSGDKLNIKNETEKGVYKKIN